MPAASPVDVAAGAHALVLARITRDKGQDIAARVAHRSGHPVVLAGPVAGIGDPAELAARLADPSDPVLAHPDAAYWRDEVAPLVDGELVRWVGGVCGSRTRNGWLQGARVLFTPIRWAEPGATSVIEALGRGIPVVGTPLGVLPSLVRDGVTGFLADTEADLALALGRVDALDPAACRASAAAGPRAAMAARYLELLPPAAGRGPPVTRVLLVGAGGVARRHVQVLAGLGRRGRRGSRRPPSRRRPRPSPPSAVPRRTPRSSRRSTGAVPMPSTSACRRSRTASPDAPRSTGGCRSSSRSRVGVDLDVPRTRPPGGEGRRGHRDRLPLALSRHRHARQALLAELARPCSASATGSTSARPWPGGPIRERSGGQVVEQLTHVLDLARVLLGEAAGGVRRRRPPRRPADADPG